MNEIAFAQLRNRVLELEKLHWPNGPRHDHPDIGVRDGRDIGKIHPTAVIADCVKLGKNVVIGPNVVIGNRGFGYTRNEWGEYHWRDHPFGVVIGDNVEIGAGTVIDRGRYRDTVIGEGTKIDANVFIAHNCIIGKHCLIVANSQISGSCEIGFAAHIGPAAMLTDHIKVGARGRCGMGAVVIRDVPAGVTVVGNPARDIEERRQSVDVTSFGASPKAHLPGLRLDVVAGEECRANLPTNYALDAPDVHPGSHGDIRTPDWNEAFGDGSDEFSLPVPRPDHSELGQRQRAAQQGWQSKCR